MPETSLGREARQSHFKWLLIALVLLLASPVFVPPEILVGLRLVGFLFACVLLAAIYAIAGGRRTAGFGLALGIPAALVRIFATSAPTDELRLIAGGLSIVFLAFTIWVILSSVLAYGRVTSDRIYGAICVYLLLGLVWANCYALLEAGHPGSFHPPDAVDETMASAGDETGLEPFVYYSFATLTTLGYGDIAPLTRRARSLAWLEALTGQLFIAITIARLVGMQITQPHGD